MFTDNWWLFVLLIMLLFSSDGCMDCTENSVLIAIVFSLFLCEGNSNLFGCCSSTT